LHLDFELKNKLDKEYFFYYFSRFFFKAGVTGGAMAASTLVHENRHR
jgi:hypothetical protein